MAGSAQLTGLENGQWRYLGGDAGHTRFSQLNQINASNFSTLKVAWIFRGDNVGPGIEYTALATPVFVDGVLYTVVGQRRKWWRLAFSVSRIPPSVCAVSTYSNRSRSWSLPAKVSVSTRRP